jgi:hypothetical protein
MKPANPSGTVSDDWYTLPVAGSLLGIGGQALTKMAKDGDLPVLENNTGRKTMRVVPAGLVKAALALVHAGERIEFRSFARAWAAANVRGRLALVVHGLDADQARALIEWAAERGASVTGMPSIGTATA